MEELLLSLLLKALAVLAEAALLQLVRSWWAGVRANAPAAMARA